MRLFNKAAASQTRRGLEMGARMVTSFETSTSAKYRYLIASPGSERALVLARYTRFDSISNWSRISRVMLAEMHPGKIEHSSSLELALKL